MGDIIKYRDKLYIILLGIAAFVGTVFFVVAVSDTRDSDVSEAAMMNGPAVNDPIVGPCSGDKVTLAAARRQVPFKLYRANHPLANDENLVQAWDCPGPMVALEYGSDVKVYLSVNTLRAPEATWAEMAARYEEFATGVSRGEPASFSDPYNSSNGTADGGVDLVENGIRLTVSGNGEIPLADLKEVMESLRQEN